MANPCWGFSQTSLRTTWSSTDGVYSLTVTILARLRSLIVVLVVVVGVGAPAHAEQIQTKRITITVSAAASLSKAYTELGKQFEKANPSIRVRFNFASTASLVSQIQSGAPTDVFAAADLTSFDKLLASGNVVKSPKVFARNSIQLIVKRSNPLGVSSVTDLTKASVVSLCAKTVPCGVYAATVLSRYGVVIAESKITRGVDATATLNAVSTGDADAAIVYATDALSAKKSVLAIAIPASKNVNASYGIAVIRGSKNSKQSEAFVQFVVSPAGQKVLKIFGFLAP
jgi:molybdate transport system substrate-binding protein